MWYTCRGYLFLNFVWDDVLIADTIQLETDPSEVCSKVLPDFITNKSLERRVKFCRKTKETATQTYQMLL